MWTLSSPAVTASDVALACSASCAPTLDQRVIEHLGQFEANNEKLRAAAQTSSLTQLQPSDFDVAGISTAELVGLYDQHLVPKDKPGRSLYEAILAAARLQKCVYCSYGIALTIDHYLPKKAFPGLSIAPWNFVPCCKDCNHVMGTYYSTTESSSFLHPCHCDIDSVTWLTATVSPGTPGAVTYRVQPHASWDTTLTSRVTNQFGRLKLSDRYVAASASAIVETSASLVRLYEVGGESALRVQLQEMITGAVTAEGQNYWRAALFRALNESDWYCQGGLQSCL